MAAKTIRFRQVVEKAGHPETYTLWAKPDQDKVFTSLLRQTRVMTVHQEAAGSKADYGEVGYTHDLRSSLLVFPKSLKRFENKRIIGIKYEELKEESSAKPKTKPAKLQNKAKPPTKRKLQITPKPKKEQPAPVSKVLKETAAPAPPSNQIPFPTQEIVQHSEPDEDPEPDVAHLSRELASLRKQVRKALDALSKDKAVTAYDLLKTAVAPK